MNEPESQPLDHELELAITHLQNLASVDVTSINNFSNLVQQTARVGDDLLIVLKRYGKQFSGQLLLDSGTEVDVTGQHLSFIRKLGISQVELLGRVAPLNSVPTSGIAIKKWDITPELTAGLPISERLAAYVPNVLITLPSHKEFWEIANEDLFAQIIRSGNVIIYPQKQPKNPELQQLFLKHLQEGLRAVLAALELTKGKTLEE